MTERKYILAYLQVVTLAVCSFLLFGCVSAHLTHLDPSFTPTALKEGALAVGGVTVIDTAEELDDRQRASVIDNFEREMKKRRPELGLLAHQEVVSALGDKTLQSAISAAASEGVIPPEELAPLIPKGAHYVAFIVVTYNAVDRYVTNNTDTRNVYDDEGKVTGRTVKYITIAQAKRSVTAEYRIFDVETGKRLWASESSNSRSRRRTADSREGYPEAPEYGATPTASRVLRPMTAAAVKDLPAPQKKTPQPVVPTVSDSAE